MIYGNPQTRRRAVPAVAVLRGIALILALCVAVTAAYSVGRAAADSISKPASDGWDGYDAVPALIHLAENGQADAAAALLAAAESRAETERLEMLKVYEQADFDFMHGVVYEPAAADAQ